MRKRMIAALLCLAFALPAWGWSWGALCGKGSADEVAAMIKKDANVNAADEDGETPLMVAVKKGNAPVVDVLLASGAKVNAKNANFDPGRQSPRAERRDRRLAAEGRRRRQDGDKRRRDRADDGLPCQPAQTARH